MLFRPNAIYICNWGYHALSSKGQSICAGTAETVQNLVRKWYFSLKKRSRKKFIFPLLDAQKMSAHMRTLTQGSVAPEEEFSIHGMHYTLPQICSQDSRFKKPPASKILTLRQNGKLCWKNYAQIMQVHTYHANQSTINKCLWLVGHIMVFFICQNTTLFA